MELWGEHRITRDFCAALALGLVIISVISFNAGGHDAKACAFWEGIASALAWFLSAFLPMYFLETRAWGQVLFGLNCIAAAATAGAVLASVA